MSRLKKREKNRPPSEKRVTGKQNKKKKRSDQSFLGYQREFL